MKRSLPPPDLVPTAPAQRYAIAHGLDLEDELEWWLDWSNANGRLYADHQAGFRTWLRRAVQYGRGRLPIPETAPEPSRFGTYVCPLGLGCDNGWVADTSPVVQCKCRKLAPQHKLRLVQSGEQAFDKRKGAPSEDSAPNPTLFTNMVEFSASPTRSR